MNTYTVSQDQKSGLWYCHMKGYTYIPVAGSFCNTRAEALEWAKMMNCRPHRVNEIEKRRQREREK